MKTVFAQINRLNDAYLDVWEDICNIESPSSDKSGVDRVGAYCRKIADAAHRILEIERFKDDSGVTCNCGLISGGTATHAAE